MKQIKKFISYVIVGSGATVVEWIFYWLFSNVFGIQYLLATTFAIIISTFSNWLFGRLLTFREVAKQNVLKEIGKIYAASVAGLLMNLFLMWLLHGQLNIQDMLAKIIATGVVFIYNYLIRLFVIYK